DPAHRSRVYAAGSARRPRGARPLPRDDPGAGLGGRRKYLEYGGGLHRRAAQEGGRGPSGPPDPHGLPGGLHAQGIGRWGGRMKIRTDLPTSVRARLTLWHVLVLALALGVVGEILRYT